MNSADGRTKLTDFRTKWMGYPPQKNHWAHRYLMSGKAKQAKK